MIYKTLSTVVDDLFAYVPVLSIERKNTDYNFCTDSALKCLSCIALPASVMT